MDRKRTCCHWLMFSLAGKIIIGQTIFVLSTLTILFGQGGIPSNPLVDELGCGNCHSGTEKSENIFQRTPDLSYAGVKYNNAFLYDYLKSPYSVRHNIGNSRMPDFGFSDDEALALTLYFTGKRALPETVQVTEINFNKGKNGFEILHNDYQCTKCHQLNGVGELKSTDLSQAGFRLNAGWLSNFIQNPEPYLPKGSSMPDFFGSNEAHGLDQRSTKLLNTIVSYLAQINSNKRQQLEKEFRKARKAYTNVTAEMGRIIFLSQNCQACHTMKDETPWFKHNAPDLTAQQMRTQPQWLKTYLGSLSPIRPFGYFPGTGSRMPNFGLNEAEIEELTGWLGAAELKTVAQPISAFQSKKVEKLLDDFLPCLGCHQMDGKGGRIGPDLSNAGNRLTDGFIKMAVTMPHMVMPESIMPKTAIDPNLRNLVISYLARKSSNSKTEYPNLIQNTPYQIRDSYTANCAPCHGLNGNGAGFNKEFLPIKPGDFTDGKLMSERTDDTLFDTINVGGRIMNKSHFMPAWGKKMSQEEIINYVKIIRGFCDCEQPGWAKK